MAFNIASAVGKPTDNPANDKNDVYEFSSTICCAQNPNNVPRYINSSSFIEAWRQSDI